MTYPIRPALTVAQKQEAVNNIKQAFYETSDNFFTEMLHDPETALKTFWWKHHLHKLDLTEIENRATLEELAEQAGIALQSVTAADHTPAEARAMDALSDIINELGVHPDSKIFSVLSLVADIIEAGKTHDLDELIREYFPANLIRVTNNNE